MTGDKVSGIREEVWISYKDDNDNTVTGFVELIEMSDTLVTFRTNRNTITIPIIRLLKMKRRGDYGS